MNRISIAAVLAFSLALAGAVFPATAQQNGDTTTQAQEHGGKHHRMHDPHKAAMHLSKKLGLSSDQTAKVEPILADRQQKVQALRADTSLTEQQRHEQMRTIQQNTQQQMSSILTPEQMERLKSMHKGRHHRDSVPTGA